MAPGSSQFPFFRSPADSARAGRHRRRWTLAALALLAVGAASSVLAARMVARTDQKQARSEFIASANASAAAIATVLQHEEDLVISARAYINGDAEGSNETQRGFLEWTRSVEALTRFPEITGGGEVQFVPRAGLAAFIARQEAEPALGATAGGKFTVIPAGRRPFYCLVALSFARQVEPATASPAGLDYCTVPNLRGVMLQARDTALNAYFPVLSGKTTVLAIYTPLYRGIGVPSTLAGRRSRFRGAFGTTILPQVILAAARRGQSTAIVLRRPASQVHFGAGTAPAHAQRTTRTLQNGWLMEASGPPVVSSVLADSKALVLMLGGIVLTVLLSLLVYVLGTGRERARSMVHEQTLEITHQALHDALTGLPNRVLVLDRAEQMLARSRREPSIVTAALYVDIDRFKYVNDSFGHAAGDTLLTVVGERLQSVMRDQDTVGRMGGDEFVVLLESSAHEAPPETIAQRVIEVLREPVALEEGRTISMSVSIGIAIGSRPTAEQLLQDADLALYTAKAAGKDRAILFEASMQNVAAARLDLELDLSRALEERQFFMLYQPIVELDSGRVTAVEALIRWRHPTRGVVAPEDFVPLAEETGRIVPIGRWALREACRQASIWKAQGRPIGLSVNVSTWQLDREDFAGDVRRALGESGIEPSSLTLEITETALMHDAPAAARRLREIKTLGVRVAIDDFGTGSSSLSYLRQFDVDAIKIDQSFIAAMSASTESEAIVHTLIELGGLLGIECVAEGVEHPDQLARLRVEGCDHGQGFLFAHPLDPPELESYLGNVAERRPRSIA